MHVLRNAKLGKPVERWFAQNRLAVRPENLKHFYAIYGSRLIGRPIGVLEYTPLDQAPRVAGWLATKKKQGTPAELITYPSSGVRVCLAAREHGLDISGTFFRLSGEPYTQAKAQMMSEAGCRAVFQYTMAEIGQIGIACAAPASLDEVHLCRDKLAVIQRDKAVGEGGRSVGALLYTTLLPSCPKLMLNVESDDYGVLEDRDCGCPIGELGFRQHLHSIRSYAKLTSEGMNFWGSKLISLVEEVLPARFGGHSADYQLVEEEEAGLTKLNLVVSAQVGEVDEEQLLTTVLEVLSSHPGLKMMADQWREGNTLRVVRREPHATPASKILPLHILNIGTSH